MNIQISQFDNWKATLGTDCKVIVKNNEEEVFEVGILKGFDDNNIPLVEIEEKVWMCMGIVIPYTKEVENFLSTIQPYKRQWEILRGISLAIQINHRKSRK